jgi:spermidine/putrescine transport system substrate-binding protein
MNQLFLKKWLFFFLVPMFWLIILILFLYSPYAKRFIQRHQDSITVYVWSDMIKPEVVKSFEAETGIKVYLNYYEGNDELLTKLEFSGGSGYDIIMPTHYMIKPLLERGFLKEIDKSRLNFWKDLDPHLTGLYYDPDNTYALPYVWEIYGLGYDDEFFKNKTVNDSWQMLFEPQYNYRVGMTDEPREVFNIAGLYLFENLKNITSLSADAIKILLRNQKKVVEAYTDLNLDFLLISRAASVVLLPSSIFYRAKRLYDGVKFLLPQEGTVLTIENLAISAKSNKDELVYKFLNYLFERKILKEIYDDYGYFPTRKDFLYDLDTSDIASMDYVFGSYFSKTSLIKSLFSRGEMAKLWLAIKS